MHESMSNAGRAELKKLLSQLESKHHEMFKLMYGRNGGKRTVEDTKAMDIHDVIDEIPEDKLSVAIFQCERTLEKNRRKEISEMKAGDFVHYKVPHSTIENGRIKSIGDDTAFVVYKCNNEWWRHDDYTGQKTGLDCLYPGWVDKNGNPIDTPKIEGEQDE